MRQDHADAGKREKDCPCLYRTMLSLRVTVMKPDQSGGCKPPWGYEGLKRKAPHSLCVARVYERIYVAARGGSADDACPCLLSCQQSPSTCLNRPNTAQQAKRSSDVHCLLKQGHRSQTADSMTHSRNGVHFLAKQSSTCSFSALHARSTWACSHDCAAFRARLSRFVDVASAALCKRASYAAAWSCFALPLHSLYSTYSA